MLEMDLEKKLQCVTLATSMLTAANTTKKLSMSMLCVTLATSVPITADTTKKLCINVKCNHDNICTNR